ncbi:MAG: hypothetical protein ACPLQO_04840 [Desulfotomaculales bacterium]
MARGIEEMAARLNRQERSPGAIIYFSCLPPANLLRSSWVMPMAGELPADKYDLTIKELFAGSEEELISFFGLLKASVLRYLNIEFPKLEVKRSDLILECRTETGPVAVHLEFQSANDKEIPFRMLRYATELHSKYN